MARDIEKTALALVLDLSKYVRKLRERIEALEKTVEALYETVGEIEPEFRYADVQETMRKYEEIVAETERLNAEEARKLMPKASGETVRFRRPKLLNDDTR